MTAPQHYPDAVEELIGAFRQLPSIGRRGAERLVLAMLNWEPEVKFHELVKIMTEGDLRLLDNPNYEIGF